MKKLILVVAAIGLAVFGANSLPVGAAISPCTDGTTTLPTNMTTPYEVAAPPDNRSYDGYNSTSTAPNSASQDHAIELGGDVVRPRLCLGGLVINGNFSYGLTWRQMHDDIGGYGARIYSNSINVGDLAIDNVEDGIKMQNCAENVSACNAQQPNGRWEVTDTRLMNIRDDGIDNDDCMPGDVNSVLFEGHTFLSEQEESSSTGNCVSAGEDTTIHITGSILRTMQVNAYDGGVEDAHAGGGKWFKWQGSTAHHTVQIENTILAVDSQPRSGWSSLDMPGANGTPGDTQWIGGNNYILYLNMKGETYGGPTPGTQGIPGSGANAVHFLQGQAARDMFETYRNGWLDGHGCAARPSGDLNPKDDPVCRVAAPK